MLEYKQTISISPKFSIYIICQEYSAEQDGREERDTPPRIALSLPYLTSHSRPDLSYKTPDSNVLFCYNVNVISPKKSMNTNSQTSRSSEVLC